MKTLISLFALTLSLSAWADSPQIGDPAPDFKLQDQNGEWHQLSDYQGKYLAIYFYPKNDTPGCTTEACNFRDNIYQFKRIGAEVVGVSIDDVDSHKAFATKYKLPFTLLADKNGDLASAYGVVREYGSSKMASRESFIVGPTGQVVKHYNRVNPETHTQEVLADMEQMMAEDKAVSQR